MNRVMELFPNAREYTVEAGRPDTITRGKLETLKRLGVRPHQHQSPDHERRDPAPHRPGSYAPPRLKDTFLLARELGFDGHQHGCDYGPSRRGNGPV